MEAPLLMLPLCAKAIRQTMPVTMATYRENSPLISLDFLHYVGVILPSAIS